MIFQRKTPRRIPGLVRDDEVDDIAQGIAAGQQGAQRENRRDEQAPPSAGGTPAFFGAGDQRPRRPATPPPPGSLQDPRDTASRNASAGAAIEAGRATARKDMEEKARNNAREVRDGIDYNGDGVIGTGIEGMAGGREMTQEDVIATRVNELLTEDLDTGEARSAMDEALRQATAESRLAARARTGIAGMGLTGAAAAAEGAEARRGERERQMTLDQFDRAARAEELQRLLAGTGELRAGAREEREQTAFEKAMQLLGEELGTPSAPSAVGNTPGGGTRIDPRDTNNDGIVSDTEKREYEESVAAPLLAGHQASSDYFNGGGAYEDLPQQSPGGDVIVIRQPKTDAEGEQRGGVSYNTKTGRLGRF